MVDDYVQLRIEDDINSVVSSEICRGDTACGNNPSEVSIVYYFFWFLILNILLQSIEIRASRYSKMYFNLWPGT